MLIHSQQKGRSMFEQWGKQTSHQMGALSYLLVIGEAGWQLKIILGDPPASQHSMLQLGPSDACDEFCFHHLPIQAMGCDWLAQHMLQCS